LSVGDVNWKVICQIVYTSAISWSSFWSWDIFRRERIRGKPKLTYAQVKKINFREIIWKSFPQMNLYEETISFSFLFFSQISVYGEAYLKELLESNSTSFKIWSKTILIG